MVLIFLFDLGTFGVPMLLSFLKGLFKRSVRLSEPIKEKKDTEGMVKLETYSEPITEAIRDTLAPGGVVELTDYDYFESTEDTTPIPVDTLSVKDILATFQRLGYKAYDADDDRLNIVGVRNTENLNSNKFNDHLYVWYYKEGRPVLFHCPITTDPGIHYRFNSLVVDGTAIIIPGQHVDLWKLGKHQGKYEALVQNRPVSVYRDAEKNGELNINEYTKISTGFFGINLHRATVNGTSILVDRWSAGCQVIPNSDNYDQLIRLVRNRIRETTFTYTLLTQDQLVRS